MCTKGDTVTNIKIITLRRVEKMFYVIGEKVVYKNVVHTVVYYNVFQGEYTIKTSGGYYVEGIHHNHLEKYS